MVVKSVHSNVEGETTIQSGMLYTINPPPPPPPQKKKKKTKKLVFNSCEIIMHAALMSKVRTGKNMDSASALLMSWRH